MKLKVITPHQSNYPNPIKFAAGESLIIGKRDDQYPGWVKVTTTDNNQGWAPLDFIELNSANNLGIAQFDYDATELTVHAGQTLTLISELNGWYWCANEAGCYGWVPCENCKSITV